MMNIRFMAGLVFCSSLILAGCDNTTRNGAQTGNTMQPIKSKALDYTKDGQTDSDHLWLEDVTGENALEKVKGWNSASAPKMQTPTYSAMKAELLEVYNSPEKIPYVSYRAGKVHNFWQDDKNVKGLWRMTTLDEYQSGDPKWETVIDFDALAEREGKNWVYKGNTCLAPDYTKCMVNLSIGGKDAVERREFDIETKTFVDGGFVSAESKGAVTWLGPDHLIIGTNFGEGTMTDSGYPRQVKLWKRGTPLDSAQLLYEGPKEDVGHWGYTLELADGTEEIVLQKSTGFFQRDYFWLPRKDDGFADPVKFPIPAKSSLSGEYKGQELLLLQDDWRGFKSGALVSFDLADFMDDGKIDKVHEVITPTERQSIENFGITKSGVLLSLFENVSGAAVALDFKDGVWTQTKLDFPENGNVSIGATNSKENVAFINTESFLDPDTYWSINMDTQKIDKVRALPAWFDSSSMVSEQHFVKSSDGTEIPYFVVRNKDMKMDGSNPTLLYGYGGFRISLNPSYSATIGRAWLNRGGVYVLANTRGGEEFGPAWHQAGLKEKRQIIYDDFIAVAEDLIDRKITTPAHLGIHGRSNGGLLMGVMFTQRPDLFNAVVIGVPLLDMHRYHKLLAGASWVGEYGDPDAGGAEGEFIRNLSPYHNLREGVDYPEPYIYTSTKDDRVHPAHARKFAQRLEDMGLPFVYYENIDGGHAGAANLEETAHSQALIYSYLASKLMEE
jgi:prolyl oligopeptidase